MVYKKTSNGDWKFSLANLLTIIGLVAAAVLFVTSQISRVENTVTEIRTKLDMHFRECDEIKKDIKELELDYRAVDKKVTALEAKP